MFVVSQFGWIGFRDATLPLAFPQGTVSKFHPALHARADQVTFSPHGSGPGMGQNP